MPSLQTLCNRMQYWCQTANLGYSQNDRWNIRDGGNCDCSSLVIFCLQEAGFNTGNASYTGNMSQNLTSLGWSRIANNNNPQPGDILLNDADHVAVYLGGSLLAQASQSENNSANGVGGDQTGQETNVSKYYNFPWDCYLRYQGEENMSISDEDAQKIAGKVWEYNWNGTATGGNMYNTLGSIWNKVRGLAGEIWGYSWKDNKTGQGAPEGGNMYNQIGLMNSRLKQLETENAALSQAVKTLSESLGTDPTTIANNVQQAVKEKVEKLKFNVTE